MTDEQIMRTRALELAVGVHGNPNHIAKATEFLEFMKAGDAAVEAPITETVAKKVSRK